MLAAMNEAAPRPATYQDVLDAPPHMVAELIGGRLRLSPRPASPHVLASSRLQVEIGGPFGKGPGGWWILVEPELHLGPDVLVPDLAGPKVYEMKELLRGYLTATGKHRMIMPMRFPGKAGKAYRNGDNLSLDATTGKRTWEDFLAAKLAE